MLLPAIQVGDGFHDFSPPIDFRKLTCLEQGCSRLAWDCDKLTVSGLLRTLWVTFETQGYQMRPKLKNWLKRGGTVMPHLLFTHYQQDVQLRLIQVTFDRATMLNTVMGGLSIPFHFRMGIATDRGVSVSF